MGLVSAIAVAFLFVMLGLTWTAVVAASVHFLGVVAIVVAIVVLIDALWLYGRHYARRGD